MGRAPCCDKANVKKGPWSPEEDAILKAYIEQHGTGGNWIALPQKIGLKRCGKSCRLRWLNYLRPNIKHGGFSEEEDNIICSLYISIGSRWSIIAAQLPGRTDNDIKNYWNTRLKKKLLGKQRKEQHAAGRGAAAGSTCYLQKQEMMNNERLESGYDHEISSSNLMVPAAATSALIMNQSTSCWPQLPSVLSGTSSINTSPQGHQSSSSSPFRDLLFKLGGRFSIDDHLREQQQSMMTTTSYSPFGASNLSSSQDRQLLHEFDSTTISTTSFLASPTSTSTYSQLYNASTTAPDNMSQGLAMNVPIDDDQLLNHQLLYCTKNHQQQQQLDELERLYGTTNPMTNNAGRSCSSNNTTSAESTTSSSWGDINSFIYSVMVSDNETTLQAQASVPVQDSPSYFIQNPATYFPHK